MGAADVDRSFQIQATGRDRAGNEAVAIPGTARADGVAPQLGELRVSPERVRAGVPFTVSFDVDDPDAVLRVLVAGREMEAQDPPEEGFDRSFRYTPREGDAEGEQPVTVQVTDLAGNSAQASAAVVFDFRAPVLRLTVEPAGRPARAEEELRVTVSSDEPVAPEALELAHGGLALEADEVGADDGGRTITSRTWTYPVPDHEPYTEVQVVATARDAAGNEAEPLRAGVEVDGVAPEIGRAHV